MPTNMMQFANFIRCQKNPEQYLLNMLEQQNNPMTQNIAKLLRNNRQGEVELIVKNIMKERGLDFDTEFANFKRMIGF